jgi:hypothetical protein
VRKNLGKAQNLKYCISSNSVHRKVEFHTSSPKGKKLAKLDWNQRSSYLPALFQATYKEEIPHNSEHKIRELVAGNYYESPQHELL